MDPSDSHTDYYQSFISPMGQRSQQYFFHLTLFSVAICCATPHVSSTLPQLFGISIKMLPLSTLDCYDFACINNITIKTS